MDQLIIFILILIIVLLSGDKFVAALCLILVFVFLNKPKEKNETFLNRFVEIPQEEYNMRQIPPYPKDYDEKYSFDAITRGKNAEKSRIGTASSKINELKPLFNDVLTYNENADWWNNENNFPHYSALYNYYK